MILVCEVDYFRKKFENVENKHFLKNQKKVYKQTLRGLVFFKSARGVWNHLYFNS